MPAKVTIKAAPAAPTHVQGDGRPFSLAHRRSPAIIPRQKLYAALEAACVAPRKIPALVRVIADAMGKYLGPSVARKLDHAASLRALEQVAARSMALATLIESIDSFYLHEVDKARPDTNWGAPTPPFDLLHLTQTLKRLATAAVKAGEMVPPRPKGRPANEALDELIEALLPALERAKLPVRLVHSGSREPRRRMEGPGGRLLRDILMLVGARVDESLLLGSVERVERKLKELAAAKRAQRAEAKSAAKQRYQETSRSRPKSL